MLVSLQAAQAKQAAAEDRQALEVSRMEGEEMAAELERTQQCLTTLQADLIPAEQAYRISAMLGVSWPISRSFIVVREHARGVNRMLNKVPRHHLQSSCHLSRLLKMSECWVTGSWSSRVSAW